MKTLIIWTVLFVSLIGTIAFLLSQRNDAADKSASDGDGKDVLKAPLTFDQATIYTCTGGSVVAAAFKTGDTSVLELSLPNSNPLILKSTEAASGAKYINDTGIIFWEKAGVAIVEKDNEIIFTDCKVGQALGEAVVATTSPSELADTVWVWTETIYATGTPVAPNKPADFILTFAENNRFSANTDCNNVGGAFVGGIDGSVSFSEVVSTLMACEGDTKEAAFIGMLAQVVSYKLTGSELILSLKSNEENGEMKFMKQ